MKKEEFFKEIFYQIKDEDIKELKEGLISVLVVRDMRLPYNSLLERLNVIGRLQKQDGLIGELQKQGVNNDFVKVVSKKKYNTIPWHSDRTYHSHPPRFVVLYALSIPHQGKEDITLFCDLQRVYQEMPEKMIRKLSCLQLLHLNRNLLNPKVRKLAIRSFPCVQAVHPLVQSDRKGKYLFFNRMYVVDFPLKEKLCEYIYQKNYIYEHHWALFDLVIFNNFKTNHMRHKTPESKIPRTIARFHLN